MDCLDVQIMHSRQQYASKSSRSPDICHVIDYNQLLRVDPASFCGFCRKALLVLRTHRSGSYLRKKQPVGLQRFESFHDKRVLPPSFRCWSCCSSVRFHKWRQGVIVITEESFGTSHWNPTSCSVRPSVGILSQLHLSSRGPEMRPPVGMKSEFMRSYEGSCVFKTARSSSVCLLGSILPMQEGRSANPKTVHQPRCVLWGFMVKFITTLVCRNNRFGWKADLKQQRFEGR